MQLFFTDETNITSNTQMGFFVFGGLVTDAENVKNLSINLFEIKEKFGIKKERPIKWPNINWNGEGALDKDLHANIKERILKSVAESDTKIIICLTPQFFYHVEKMVGSEIRQIIDKDKYAREQGYSINLLLEKFNEYLVTLNDFGLLLADNFARNLKEAMKTHCFSLFPKGTKLSTLDNIIYPVIELDNEYSPMHQISDVVLGAVSYSLMESKHNFLPSLRSNFWSSTPQDKGSIIRRGFNVYPTHPRSPSLRFQLQNICEKFIKLLD